MTKSRRATPLQNVSAVLVVRAVLLNILIKIAPAGGLILQLPYCLGMDWELVRKKITKPRKEPALTRCTFLRQWSNWFTFASMNDGVVGAPAPYLLDPSSQCNLRARSLRVCSALSIYCCQAAESGRMLLLRMWQSALDETEISHRRLGLWA